MTAKETEPVNSLFAKVIDGRSAFPDSASLVGKKLAATFLLGAEAEPSIGAPKLMSKQNRIKLDCHIANSCRIPNVVLQ